jgi:hypothetical protein
MSPRTKVRIHPEKNAKRKSPPGRKNSKFAVVRGGKQRKTEDGPVGGGGGISARQEIDSLVVGGNQCNKTVDGLKQSNSSSSS